MNRGSTWVGGCVKILVPPCWVGQRPSRWSGAVLASGRARADGSGYVTSQDISGYLVLECRCLGRASIVVTDTQTRTLVIR